MTPDDLQIVAAIETRIQRAPWSAAHFQAELDKPYSHVLLLTDDETDSQILGYLAYWLLEGRCHLLTLGLDHPFRGLGLAKEMVRHVISEAIRESAKEVVLEVRKSNVPAIQLYQSAGFSITHVREKYYSDGEDAYFMKLTP